MARLLVVDDDPITRQFFLEARARAGDTVCCAQDIRTALMLAVTEPFDAILLDLHLPDGNGEDMLRGLRDDPTAASRQTPAIATSAELTPAQRRVLIGAGFVEALRKPITVHELDALLAATVPACANRAGLAISINTGAATATLLLDDARALGATGDAAIVAALRALLASELVSLEAELRLAIEAGDTTAACDRLHRLRAACGFCGANALDAAGETLRAALDHSPATRDAAWHAFAQSLRATSAALAKLN